MPISYRVDRAQGVVFEVYSDDVSDVDLRAHWDLMLRDPEAMALRRSLSDLRTARMLITGAQLQALVTSVAIPLLAGRDWRAAMVVAEPLQFGVARQFQVFAEVYSRDSIFTDPDKALRWLLEKD